jgi:hypothetical protein
MATTGRDSGRSSVKELFSTKAKCVVNPDFTLDHYNISGSAGNFDSPVADQASDSFYGTGAAASSYVTITNSDLDWTPGTDARTWSIWFKQDPSFQQLNSPAFTHGAT